MTAQLVGGPALEPVSLVEAKAHLRLETDTEDDLVSALVTAARTHLEASIGRALITQTWRIWRDAWPESGTLTLEIAPVTAVSAVSTWSAAGVATVVPPTSYALDLVGASPRIVATPGVRIAGERAVNAISVDVTAGYGPSGLSVPQPLRQAIMMLVARWYEDRDGTTIGVVPAEAADAWAALVAPYRRVRLA